MKVSELSQSASILGSSSKSGEHGLHPRAWRYTRPSSTSLVELGLVQGVKVALPTHFHDEDQFTFVLAGRRRFIICDSLYEVLANQGICIPAGVAHRSMDEASGVLCVNLYLSPGQSDASVLVEKLRKAHLIRGAEMRDEDLLSVVDESCTVPALAPSSTHRAPTLRRATTVRGAAERVQMSREAFSRKFKREHGIAPQGFLLLKRLNDARQMLREGAQIATVAAEVGFSDQSHLGRMFRRSFGVTPKQYRCGD